MAYACFCMLLLSFFLTASMQVWDHWNAKSGKGWNHASLLSAEKGYISHIRYHDQSYLCLQQRCANCITQDFLLRPRRSYFWKWSQGQHKCHHGCVWTTKMGKEKTTITEHEKPNKHWAAGIFPLQYKWPAHWTSPCKGRFSNCTSSA